jgi:hypothetical protein
MAAAGMSMDFTQIDEATEAVRVGLPGQIVADDEIQTEALRVPQFR